MQHDRLLDVARIRAYGGVASIGWPGMQYRTDIAREAAGESASRTDRKAGAVR